MGLGGSSSINSMSYIRGHAGDHDDWAELGCMGWAFADVLPTFKDLERNRLGQDLAYHGTSGEPGRQAVRPENDLLIGFGANYRFGADRPSVLIELDRTAAVDEDRLRRIAPGFLADLVLIAGASTA
ncbi:GMC oxidoreductase [Palleronia marisminoris]|uniref:Oxygen-dependent choline dehydrogenase n=1 Tax=Palleronia marisminoris TaxID=315423 RepID=A0A1Y5RMM8_9RHOB|nr:GMC oxidoreductase [Palleronia marisminoris]SLN21039.1 Oxygen-dependent choline dehydrogenase [Palleronia marisminoris]